MSTAMPTLETPRLLIRPFQMSDLGAVSVLLDACFGPASKKDRELWLEWTIRRYREQAAMNEPPYGDRAVLLRDTGELLGSVGVVTSFGPFDRLPWFAAKLSAPGSSLHRPEMGLFWAVSPAQRGNGFAAEAARAVLDWLFSSLSLARVVATTEHDNLASQAVMMRLGMAVQSNPTNEPPWFQVVGVIQNPAAELDASAVEGCLEGALES